MRQFLWKTMMPLAMMLALQACKKEEAGRCDDNKDNDKNGQTDCDDDACFGDAACSAPEVCNDGADNDQDGTTDCDDSDCNNADGCVGGACSADAECAGTNGDCLAETPDGFPAGYCVSDCDPAAGNADCAGGFCIDFGDGTGLCAGDCTVATQDADCRDGYSCQDLGDGVQFACLPACTSNDQCVDAGNICLANGVCGPDPAVACAAATAIAAGTTTGDLTGGTDSLTGSCQQGGSAEDIFTFTGTAGSTIVVTLDSATDLGVYARTTCADEASEIDCADVGFGGDQETLVLNIGNAPITIVVDGFAAGEEGPYTLNIAEVVCGDGVSVNGAEACDDGNTTAADGCEADCQSITAGFDCNTDAANDPDSICNLVVCGDGLSQLGEVCDDGNTTAADGCEADCLSTSFGFVCDTDAANDPDSICTDLAPICAAATVGVLGANTGDTTGGTNLFTGQTCGLFGAGDGAEQILSIIPGTAGTTGTLNIALSTATDQGVYVSTNCVDPTSEIGCVDVGVANDTCEDGTTACTDATAAADCAGIGTGLCAQEFLAVPVADAGNALSIFVDAFAVGEESAFTAVLSFTADICGNGEVTGGEGCDDGNTAIGDGCSDLCQVEDGFQCPTPGQPCIDLAPVCAAATPALVGANAGDTTNGTTLFIGATVDAAGCPDGTGAGAEVLFSFLPIADGNLVLTLVSATDLGVYVRTDCADDASELACGDVAFPGGANPDTETVTVPVTTGVPVTIFVDSFLDGEEGPFTLTVAVQ